ncbi:2-isopropylmalate synthase [Saccharopolyspora sp. NFXS83]|uniref:2-isopropylmalate synthase n=1 Tax=Saccharopolyspora sp. NFXS83 TaxID=2993560 RepID=UPI00224AAAB9|nr:2-isopropylmalate synthase [Saccharopolyspora sp. NFXS83]MCX2729099.1 2-isopropylmalate synthase [Saccharopolyspora sp. NFXS83]
MTVDLVRESALAGRVVFWEESARDGAQAKTLMTPEFRVHLAREQGRIFGADGPRHVVFAAGFPAVCTEEFEAVRKVAVEAEGAVSVAAVCRGTAQDVRQAVMSVRGTSNARIMVVVPASDAMAQIMTHRPAAEALASGADLIQEARGVDDTVAVDVCLADASRAGHALMAEHATRMTEAGAGVVILADTVGDQLPGGAGAMFTAVGAQSDSDVVLGSHLHNDLGFGLANTLLAAQAGVRVLSSSWLGIAERSGMVTTEQLLFLLAYRPDRTAELLGDQAVPWWTAPDLTLLPGIARSVSEETGVPLSVTTPIVGDGVGTISTGTPFVHPQLFQPYDPREVLGIEPRVLLTHLASARVITAVAARLGHELDKQQAKEALSWAKRHAYRQGSAVVEEHEFAGYLEGLTASAKVGAL